MDHTNFYYFSYDFLLEMQKNLGNHFQLFIAKYNDEIIAASDAFFPFSDSVKLAHEAGISAIIQPGGSKRDQDSITCCNEHDIAMVFTGMRHFKH